MAIVDSIATLESIREKVEANERLDLEDGLALLETDDVLALGEFAELARRVRGGTDDVYFVQNLYLNQTNVCRVKCKFCAFAATQKQARAYTITTEQLGEDALRQREVTGFTEIHMVNGENPHVDFSFYVDTVRALHEALPDVHLKLYTASEIHHMTTLSGLTHEEVLRELKAAGLGSLPGGGAEVFADRVRRLVAPGKEHPDEWFHVHDTAHRLGIPTHCTMLYGHVETYEERVDHLLRLRAQQDRTGGFLAFIPLAFHPENTVFERRGWRHTTGADDLKVIAVSRLLLDNVPHVKAYWILMDVATAQLALSYGADDVDGTVVEERIYHEAGATTPQEVQRFQTLMNDLHWTDNEDMCRALTTLRFNYTATWADYEAGTLAANRDAIAGRLVRFDREFGNERANALKASLADLVQRISREIPPLMVMGEAAGTAAALALDSGVAPRHVDVAALQKRLLAQGVSLGTPVPMAWNEIYTALQTGVLDGVDGSLSSGLASKHTEAAEYVTLLGNHVVIASILAVSEPWWASLPDDIRDAVAKVAHEAALYEHRKNEEYQAKLMEEWRQAGAEFTEPDRARFVARTAERRDDNLTIFHKGIYTACEPCKDHPERPPLWQIKAARIIHNKAERTVYYENARLDFFGAPIAYLPFFSHPDPTVRRKTGFLTPSMLESDPIGVGFTTPFFWNLAPNYDVTFSPTFLTRSLPS